MRRLKPFFDSQFKRTVYVDNWKTGEVDVHRFNALGWVSNWSKLLDLFISLKIPKTPYDIVSIGNWQPKNISDSLGTVYKDEPIRFDRVYQGFRIQSERVLRIQQLLQIPNKTLIFIGKDGPVDITFNEKQSFDNYSDLVLVNRSGDSQWLVHLGVVMRRLPDTLRALDALIEEKDGFEDSWQDSCELGQLV